MILLYTTPTINVKKKRKNIMNVLIKRLFIIFAFSDLDPGHVGSLYCVHSVRLWRLLRYVVEPSTFRFPCVC